MRGTKYAVLICGDVATHWGFDEFWSDVVLMREVLLKNGFAEDHIFVLYGDGADFSHPSRTNPRYIPPHPITDFAATIPNVELVFDGLATGDDVNGIPAMSEDDFLFVWTFDHGSRASVGDSLLCLRDGNMSDTDFAAHVDAIPYGYRVFAMQQCYSGGFVDNLTNDRTVIMTAAAPDELAYRADNSPTTENEVYDGIVYHHGEFDFHLFSGLTWERIDFTNVGVDASLDRFASMQEVFDYIETHDTQTETPQYDDGSLSIGEWLNLERDVFVYVRDNLSDIGMTPSTGSWWSSPDLWIRNADDGGLTHQNPITGSTNYIYARLHNRGIVNSGPVTVKFFSAGFMGTEFVYPDDYSDLITWASIDGIPAGETAIVKGPWIASEMGSAPVHPCLLAEVYEHAGVPSATDHVWESNRLAQKNLTIVQAAAGQTVLVPIVVGSRLVDMVKPHVEVRLVSGPPDLETWLEIRDKPWIDAGAIRARAARNPVAVAVEGHARLRVGVPTFEEGTQSTQTMVLDLEDGSTIELNGDDGFDSASEYDRSAARPDWRGGPVAVDLLEPRPLTIPALQRVRRTVMLGAKIPRQARPHTRYVLDVIRTDRRDRPEGGVRVEVQVRG